MENQELITFQQTVILDENECVFVQPLCDFFNIDSKYQYNIIYNNPILSNQVEKKTNTLQFDDNYRNPSSIDC